MAPPKLIKIFSKLLQAGEKFQKVKGERKSVLIILRTKL